MGNSKDDVKETEKDIERPVFAWQKMGLRTQLKFSETQLEMQAINRRVRDAEKTIQAMVAEDPQSEVPEEIVHLFQKQQKLMTQLLEVAASVIVDVPAAWLVPDAPDEINWRDKESLDYIRGDKMQELVQAFQMASAERFTPGK